MYPWIFTPSQSTTVLMAKMKLFPSLILTSYTLTSLASVAEASCTTSPPPIIFRLGNCTISPNADFPDGVDSWGLKIGIASPAQELCFCPSMNVNNTVVMKKQLCVNRTSGTNSQCISDRGGVFNEQEATSDYTPSQAGLAPDPVWESFNPAFAGGANTSIQFPSDVFLSSYPIALAEIAPNASLGQLGLANNSVFLREVVNAGMASVPAFSILAGSQSAQQPRDGHLMIGAYDANSVAGPFYNFTLSNTTTAGSRVCSLQVEVDSLVLTLPGQSGIELNTGGTPMISCIEPLDNLFRLPGTVIDLFHEHTGLQNDPSLVPNDLLVVEPGLTFNSSFNGTLTFTLKNGPVVEIPNAELTQLLLGIDQKGKRVLQNNVTVVNIFNETAPQGTAVLGKVFLSQLYLTVNYPLQQFQLAPAVTENVGALNPRMFDNVNTINCDPSPRDNAYIGVIVLGCVTAAALVLLCVWAFQRRKRTKAKERAGSKELADDSESGSHTIPLEERQIVPNVRGELEGRLERLEALVSVSSDDAQLRNGRHESMSTVISHLHPDPPRFPNLYPPFPELGHEGRAHEGQAHELGNREPLELEEQDLSPLSDR